MLRTILTGLVGSVLLVSGVSAQQPGRHPGNMPNTMRGGAMTGEMMMSMMDSADARLDRLVGTMNQATGSRKVQAMAAVINEMVAQRRMMRAHARTMMMGPGGMKSSSPDTATTPAKP